MVVEADESDGTFLRLPADVAVVTNIDPEHLDHYGTFDKVRAAFKSFVENVPFYGFAVMCLDHPEVQTLVAEIEDRRVITYGENLQADVRFENLRVDGPRSVFDVTLRDRVTGATETISDLVLPMPGRHNVSNATAAIAVAHRLGISGEAIKTGLGAFGGVKRRFTHTGTVRGIEIYDDYGHHPVEIRAVLAAARSSAKGRVVAVVQPHRYTRLQSLFSDFAACFNDADTVILAPVYAAGEEPIEFVNSEMLVERLKLGGHRDARLIDGPDELGSLIDRIAEAGDMVVFLGAGSITQWAYALPKDLEALQAKRG
ncbi:MAG: UDP-N-acetylmuramate--L-alanine ligase, partial [Rhizobiaceae bacterium]|nr:UDP-N-acetylmuramate--L-alanine ligase [Rhizobiaceae bacterium]